jgi:fatty acid desaturase
MWTIHGEQYDLRPLIRDHPGGERILRLTEGTDCTALFESYHVFSDAPRAQLAKYGPAYAGKGVDPMHEEIRTAARASIGSRGAAKTPSFVMAMLIATQVCAIAFAVYSGTVLSSIALGLVFATCSLRTIHAASHYNAVLSPRLNDAIGECVGMVLGFPFGAWVLGHVLSHHPHTNGALDVDTVVFRSPLRYAIALAPLPASISTAFHYLHTLAKGAFVGAGGAYRLRTVTRSVIATLAFHAGMLICVDGWFVMWLISIYIAGSWFLFFAQLSHVGSFGDAKGMMWSEAQVRSTENYEDGSRFWHFVSFGLTNQIEHHLAPTVSDSHTWRIRSAVRAACVKYGVPYRNNTIWTATVRLVRVVSRWARGASPF